MKLEDWPIDTRVAYPDESHLVCDYRGPGSRWCNDSLMAATEENGMRFPVGACTLGELAASIVEHAKTVHGVELAVTREHAPWCGGEHHVDGRCQVRAIKLPIPIVFETPTGEKRFAAPEAGTWFFGDGAPPRKESAHVEDEVGPGGPLMNLSEKTYRYPSRKPLEG